MQQSEADKIMRTAAGSFHRAADGLPTKEPTETSRRTVYNRAGIRVDIVTHGPHEVLVQELRNGVVRNGYFESLAEAERFAKSRGYMPIK